MVERSEGSAVFSLDAVVGESEDAEAESHGEFAQIRLQLGVSAGQVGVRAAGFLQFNDADGHAVAVQHKIESPLVVASKQRHLTDC